MYQDFYINYKKYSVKVRCKFEDGVYTALSFLIERDGEPINHFLSDRMVEIFENKVAEFAHELTLEVQ